MESTFCGGRCREPDCDCEFFLAVTTRDPANCGCNHAFTTHEDMGRLRDSSDCSSDSNFEMDTESEDGEEEEEDEEARMGGINSDDIGNIGDIEDNRQNIGDDQDWDNEEPWGGISEGTSVHIVNRRVVNRVNRRGADVKRTGKKVTRDAFVEDEDKDSGDDGGRAKGETWGGISGGEEEEEEDDKEDSGQDASRSGGSRGATDTAGPASSGGGARSGRTQGDRSCRHGSNKNKSVQNNNPKGKKRSRAEDSSDDNGDEDEDEDDGVVWGGIASELKQTRSSSSTQPARTSVVPAHSATEKAAAHQWLIAEWKRRRPKTQPKKPRVSQKTKTFLFTWMRSSKESTWYSFNSSETEYLRLMSRGLAKVPVAVMKGTGGLDLRGLISRAWGFLGDDLANNWVPLCRPITGSSRVVPLYRIPADMELDYDLLVALAGKTGSAMIYVAPMRGEITWSMLRGFPRLNVDVDRTANKSWEDGWSDDEENEAQEEDGEEVMQPKKPLHHRKRRVVQARESPSGESPSGSGSGSD